MHCIRSWEIGTFAMKRTTDSQRRKEQSTGRWEKIKLFISSKITFLVVPRELSMFFVFFLVGALMCARDVVVSLTFFPHFLLWTFYQFLLVLQILFLPFILIFNAGYGTCFMTRSMYFRHHILTVTPSGSTTVLNIQNKKKPTNTHTQMQWLLGNTVIPTYKKAIGSKA